MLPSGVRWRLVLILGLCGCAATPGPPERTSPRLAVRLEPTAPLLGDPMRGEPTWLDRGGQVMRLRGGVVEGVEDPDFLDEVAVPRSMRVFDDGGVMVLDSEGTVHAVPVGGALSPLALDGLVDAIDGTSLADFWHTDVGPSPHRLCHAIDGMTTDCFDVPEPPVQSYSMQIALAGDGAVYVYNGGMGLYRFDRGAPTQLDLDHAVAAFRRTGGGVIATTLDGLAFGLAGTEVQALPFVPQFPNSLFPPVVGTLDDYYFLSYEDASERSGCSLTSCSPHRVWWQQVVWHVVGGEKREVAYEECSEMDNSACDRETFGLALDGDVAIVMGVPFRAAGGG